MRRNRMMAIVLLLMLLLMLVSCQKQDEQIFFQPLFDFLESRGYTYTCEPLAAQGRNVSVPIYDESVWHSLMANDEELLVYFDSSNRANYLAEQFCGEEENVICVGLRFIVCYRGENAEILQMMKEWAKEYPI